MFDAGYRPPLRKPVIATGRYGLATIKAQLVNMRDGGFISAHDFKLGEMIAEIVSGGDVDQGSVVGEQWFLDMERKAFLELLNHPKSQERIMGMMQTGKPVRN
jgi:3-hydroxyacyl-CoA dehydrogenase